MKNLPSANGGQAGNQFAAQIGYKFSLRTGGLVMVCIEHVFPSALQPHVLSGFPIAAVAAGGRMVVLNI